MGQLVLLTEGNILANLFLILTKLKVGLRVMENWFTKTEIIWKEVLKMGFWLEQGNFRQKRKGMSIRVNLKMVFSKAKEYSFLVKLNFWRLIGQKISHTVPALLQKRIKLI